MITAFLQAFGLIFIAEMGDKTQILAMAFATKYKLKHVVVGIAIGSFLNHAVAIFIGALLNSFIDLSILGLIAGFLFVIFGIWTLKMDQDEEVTTLGKYGPIITVALAFFIGELGDKTQLTAFTLATQTSYPIFVLIGTVSGMVITGLLGIYVGLKLGSSIPEFYIKVAASVVFLGFGFSKLFQNAPTALRDPFVVVPFIAFVLITVYIMTTKAYAMHKKGTSLYKRTAEELYQYYQHISSNLESICLGENICGKCSEIKCLVGYTKKIINDAKEGKQTEYQAGAFLAKNFDKKKVTEALKLTIDFLRNEENPEKYETIQQVRKNLESILLYKAVPTFSNINEYIEEIKKKDKSLAKKLQ